MALKAAFMFVDTGADPATNRSTVTTPGVELLTVAVNNYAQAEDVASKLADEGYVAIELCGGFGIEGVARVKKAVPDTVAVGVVRFDHHPGLGHKSGDELY